jgi:hypothetical protein
MGNNEYLIWAAAAAGAGLLLWKLRKSAPGGKPEDAGEKSPVAVADSTAFTGMHKGVKYWIYFDNSQARMEIETGGEITVPFIADRSSGRPKLPGDARDPEVQELFRLGALNLEVAATGSLIAALFEERTLNANAGTRHAIRPEEDMANKVAELLTVIRDKSFIAPAGGPGDAA